MARPDPFLKLFSDIGFLPVRLPRADLLPLLLLEASNKEFQQLGDIETAMLTGSSPRPAVKPDIATAGSIQGSRTSRIRLGIGMELLSGLISALAGASLNVSAAYERAKTIQFLFKEVSVDRVDVTPLDSFLGAAQIRPELRHVERLMVDDKVAVVVATVKSKSFTVTAQSEDGTEIAVSVPVLKNAVAGKVDVKAEGAAQTQIVYEGDKPVVFGIQALRLFFDEGGNYTLFRNLNPGDGALRSRDPRRRERDVEPVTVEGIFAEVQ